MGRKQFKTNFLVNKKRRLLNLLFLKLLVRISIKLELLIRKLVRLMFVLPNVVKSTNFGIKVLLK